MTATIEHLGIVRSVAGGKAVVAVQTGGCSGCGHQSGCGIGRMAGGRASTEMSVAVDASIRPGAQVVLSLPQGRMLLAGVLAYLLPSVSLMFGAGLAFARYDSDGATAVGGLAGFALGVLATRLFPGLSPEPTVRPAGPAVAHEQRVEISKRNK